MIDDVMNHTVAACGLDGILSALPVENICEEGGTSSEDEKSGPDTSGSPAIDEPTEMTPSEFSSVPFQGNTAILYGSLSSAASSTLSILIAKDI